MAAASSSGVGAKAWHEWPLLVPAAGASVGDRERERACALGPSL